MKVNPNLEGEEDDQADGLSVLPVSSTQRPFYDGPMPTPQQKPFQSGSTPVHLTHRFMVGLLLIPMATLFDVMTASLIIATTVICLRLK